MPIRIGPGGPFIVPSPQPGESPNYSASTVTLPTYDVIETTRYSPQWRPGPRLTLLTPYPPPRDRRSKDTFEVQYDTPQRPPRLVTTLTSYTPYVPANDLGKLTFKRSSHVDPVFEYLPARGSVLLAVLQEYRIDLFLGSRSQDVYSEPPFEQTRRPALLALLTNYGAAYNPAPDIVLKDRRNKDADPPFQYDKQRSPWAYRDTFYRPELDQVLRDRRPKDVFADEFFKPQDLARLLVTLTAYYNPAPDTVLKDRRNKDVDPSFDYQRQQPPWIFRDTFYRPELDIVLKDRRPKDVFDGDYPPPWFARLLATLTTYVPYNPAPDIVLKDRRNKDVDPLFEYLRQAIISRLIMDGSAAPPDVVTSPPGGGGRHRQPPNRIRTRRGDIVLPPVGDAMNERELLFWALAAIAAIEEGDS